MSGKAKPRGKRRWWIAAAILTALVVGCGFGLGYREQLRLYMRTRPEMHIMTSLVELQETHFMRTGLYCDASGGEGRPGPLSPRFSGNEPALINWQPGATRQSWNKCVGAWPVETYFRWSVEASSSSNNHAPYGRAASLGIADNGKPWFYIVGYADLDGNGPPYSELQMTSRWPAPRKANWGR